jgi:protein-S-isoprenylcysteine O-methyltransferase Ste14
MNFILVILAFEVLLAGLLFGIAGRVDLPWVWGLLAVHAVLMLTLAVGMDPGLRRERLKRRDGGPDCRLRRWVAIFLLAHLVVAALDLRFGWTPAWPWKAHAIGLLVYAAGVLLSIRAAIVNRFFIPSVRIQTERGHETVSGGPYRFVRHPGYAGMVLAVIAECFVFGSLWALVPTAAFIAVIAYRTAREDRILREGLAGYAAYSRGVRYRLVPAVW